MPRVSPGLRFHTHWESNEQGLYTCTPTASMFVCFFLKVHHPPLDTSESHAGVWQGARGGGGSKAWPRISNRHTEPRRRFSPNWWNSSAAERRRRRFQHAQNAAEILFHTGTGAAAVWVKKKNACASILLELALAHRNRPDSCPQGKTWNVIQTIERRPSRAAMRNRWAINGWHRWNL